MATRIDGGAQTRHPAVPARRNGFIAGDVAVQTTLGLCGPGLVPLRRSGSDRTFFSARRFWTAVLASACAVAALGASPRAAAAEKAADLYRTYCMQCHGLAGNGQGINVRDMSVQPRDHTDAKAMAGRSDDTLFTVIKNGGPSIDKSVIMPDWAGALSDDEIRSLIPYLRQLCKCKYGGQ